MMQLPEGWEEEHVSKMMLQSIQEDSNCVSKLFEVEKAGFYLIRAVRKLSYIGLVIMAHCWI
jgi:hypothetical protein